MVPKISGVQERGWATIGQNLIVSKSIRFHVVIFWLSYIHLRYIIQIPLKQSLICPQVLNLNLVISQTQPPHS